MRRTILFRLVHPPDTVPTSPSPLFPTWPLHFLPECWKGPVSASPTSKQPLKPWKPSTETCISTRIHTTPHPRRRCSTVASKRYSRVLSKHFPWMFGSWWTGENQPPLASPLLGTRTTRQTLSQRSRTNTRVWKSTSWSRNLLQEHRTHDPKIYEFVEMKNFIGISFFKFHREKLMKSNYSSPHFLHRGYINTSQKFIRNFPEKKPKNPCHYFFPFCAGDVIMKNYLLQNCLTRILLKYSMYIFPYSFSKIAPKINYYSLLCKRRREDVRYE